jgi:hypothetical protein
VQGSPPSQVIGASQLPPPAQAMAQLPASQQVSSEKQLSAPVQAIEQLVAPVQSIGPHEKRPRHSIAHGPAPHTMPPWHESSPVHATSQLVAAVQSIATRHARSSAQVTRHGRPGGHSILVRSTAVSPRITQVPSPQPPSHTSGHTITASPLPSGPAS